MTAPGDRLFKSEQEVREYYEQDKENNQVVLFEGVVYDVKKFKDAHPGGPQYLDDNLGTDIFEEFENAEHTKYARKIFNDLPVVGKLAVESREQSEGKQESKQNVNGSAKPGDPVIDEDYTDQKKVRSDSFDYNRGISYQVWQKEWKLEEYMDFINEPKQFVNPVRDLKMFDNPYLEPLSKCPWYQPLIFWSIYIITWVPHLEGKLQIDIPVMILAVNFFFLSEYMLHRFLFHGEVYWMHYVPKNRYFYYAHFMLHGIHHAFPMDRYRLVMPPVLGYFYFATIFRSPFELLVPEAQLPAWIIGFVIGFQMYDMTHYFIHHSNPPEGSYFRMMKMYHLQHHYKKGEEGFGITNKVWDRVFNTEIKPTNELKEKKE